MMIPRVVDISHHNNVRSFREMAVAGIWGVIHKASQGRAYRDPDHATRRKAAAEAGLLFGSYHFNTGDNVAVQVENFLAVAQPDDKTLMVLDYEDNRLSNMGVVQAVEFLELLEKRLGRKGAIYSGNRLKETIGRLDRDHRNYITAHRLWLCQYGPRAVLPPGFNHYWLWQFTGDGIGMAPHSIPGIVGSGIDLNAYEGDHDQLKKEWA